MKKYKGDRKVRLPHALKGWLNPSRDIVQFHQNFEVRYAWLTFWEAIISGMLLKLAAKTPHGI